MNVNAGRALFALVVLSAALSACAYRSPDDFEGPAVTVIDEDRTYYLPAARADEAGYLERGFLKNTAEDGSTIFIRIPETDEPPREWYWEIGGNDNSDDGGDRDN